MSDFNGYPKNLAYSVKNLSGFSKISVKLNGDRDTNITAGSTVRVRLPPNCLVDLRTFTAFFEGTATATTGKAHFPRLSSSLIEQLSVYANNSLVETIQNYNVLYNTLYDISAGNDQSSKRCLENIDPSATYNITNATTGATDIVNNTLVASAHDTNKPFMINNWLGFLGSASTPVISTADLSSVDIEIRFAPASVLWAGGAGTGYAGANYTINKLRFTIAKIVFSDPTYYQLKASKLLSDGLVIGYESYISNRGSQVAKGTSLSYSVNVNASSLNQVIATCLTDAFDTPAPLLLAGAGQDTGGTPFNQAVAANIADANSLATRGDLFNQSKYFRRDGMGLVGSSFEINNVQMNPYLLPPEEVFNETLIAMGNLNIDMSSGIHPGIQSVAHYLKYYFTHILSLENITNDGQFWKSGLDGRAAPLNIVWKTSFSTTTNITPFIFCNVSKLLQINDGAQVNVIT